MHKQSSTESKGNATDDKAAASPMISQQVKNELSGSEWDKNLMTTEGNHDVAESSLNARDHDLITKRINEARFNSKFSNQV